MPTFKFRGSSQDKDITFRKARYNKKYTILDTPTTSVTKYAKLL